MHLKHPSGSKEYCGSLDVDHRLTGAVHNDAKPTSDHEHFFPFQFAYFRHLSCFCLFVYNNLNQQPNQ